MNLEDKNRKENYQQKLHLSISQTAKQTGISARTLQYYDEIGLLPPSETSEAGYRFYDEKALLTLQQILFLKELDFPLKEIRSILLNPDYDRQKALQAQSHLLRMKLRRMERILALLEDTMKGENSMQFEEFDLTEIEEAKEKYAEEVKSRWGHTDAYKESAKKTASYGKEEWKAIQEEANGLYARFAALANTDPAAQTAQTLVAEWQAHITKYYYRCTTEILAALGQMYTADSRFTENINRHGEGTAEFMSKAIAVFCSDI